MKNLAFLPSQWVNCFILPWMFLALLASCVSGHVNSKKINKDAFPPGFNDPNCVLLLQKRTSGMNHKGMNNYLNKYFKKYYSGKFEMASLEDITKDPKYQDKKIYRYLLTDEVWTSSSTTRTTTSTGTSFEYNNAYRLGYHLYDLLEAKRYPEIGISSNVPAKAMKRAALVLDKQLHK